MNVTPTRVALSLVCALLVGAPLTAQEGKTVEAGATKNAVKTAIHQAEIAWQAQDWSSAATAYAKVVELAPDNGLAWHHLGYARHALGEYESALVAHMKAAKFPDVAPTATYNVACVYSLQGNKDDAITWLKKAAEAGFRNAGHMASDPDLDNIRNDPRYKKFVEKLGTAVPAVQAFAATTPRASTRLSFWGQAGSPGQIVIDYGRPEWKPEYDKALDSEKLTGQRWRLGRDFWTTFDTNVDLKVGKQKVPAGSYYLTLEKNADGEFILAFNDPQMIRKHKLDAYFASKTKGGIEVPVQYQAMDETADELTFGMKSKDGDVTHAKMWIHFGGHEVTTEIAIHFEG